MLGHYGQKKDNEAMIFGQTAGLDSKPPAKTLPRGAVLALALGIIWAVLAALTLMPGGLTLTRHEGDAAHLAAAVLRLADGEWPHLNFMTPIGIGAFAPISAFVAQGLGLGTAFLAAQAAVAALLLPALWWVGLSRFGGGWLGLGFGALALSLTMALIYGGPEPAVSVSMHYNRWAWAVAFILIAMALVPPARPAPRIEGLILGLGFAALALTKATYFVGLAPMALAALMLRRDWAALAWAAGTGLAVVAALTAALGMGYWAAYLGDLLTVAVSESRPHPGATLSEILSGPTHLATTLLLIGAVVVLRRSGQKEPGMVLLIALPGFALITWQNFGNDPQWLPVLALSMLALRPSGRVAQGHMMVALLAGALFLPSVLNVATSPIRLSAAWSDESVPLLPGLPRHDDFRVTTTRLDGLNVVVPHPATAEAPVATFWGGTMPACEMRSAAAEGYRRMAEEVAAAGFAGQRAFLADIVQSLWLYGDVGRLPNGAPWYYGGLPGVRNAEIVVVPHCPSREHGRKRALDALEEAAVPVREAFRGEFATILTIAPPAER